MTEYKKEPPKLDPWNGFVTPEQRIEHYLALIIRLFDAVGHDNVTREEVAEIIDFVKDIWDLVPEEKEIKWRTCKKCGLEGHPDWEKCNRCGHKHE